MRKRVISSSNSRYQQSRGREEPPKYVPRRLVEWSYSKGSVNVESGKTAEDSPIYDEHERNEECRENRHRLQVCPPGQACSRPQVEELDSDAGKGNP